MTNRYEHRNHSKYLLRYHLIFVCKYRLKLLVYENVVRTVKTLSNIVSQKYDVKICYVEVDRDHIHYMIQTPPTIYLSDFVRALKSYTTYWLWKTYPDWLSGIFWKENTFWSDGYFIASIGEVSSETLRHYIENQGKDE